MTKHIHLLVMAAAMTPLFAGQISAQEATVMNNIRISNVSAQQMGSEMVIAMDICLDDVKLRSNRSMVLTPYLENVDGEQKELAQPIMINGRKQHIFYQRNGKKSNYTDALEVRRENGTEQTISYRTQVPYQSWMENYKLNIYEDECGCGQLLAQAGNELMEHLSLPTDAFFAYVAPEMEAVKARSVEGKAYLDFPVNQTTIYPDYRRNPEELAVILQTINVVKDDPNVSITGINIHGYASPEGSYANNTRLAEGRAKALMDYVRRLYNFPADIFTVESTPEDWTGLVKWLEASHLSDKEAILAIANSDLGPDAKDQKIKKEYPAAYATLLADCYPALRHSDYVVHYIIRPFTLEEAKEIIKSNPSQLSLYEIYEVANSYEKGSDAFRETLITAATLYPNNAEANLNAANALVEAGDISSANTFLARAGNLPQAQMLRGIILMKQGDIAAARPLFEEARAAAIPQATDNLKLIEKFK